MEHGPFGRRAEALALFLVIAAGCKSPAARPASQPSTASVPAPAPTSAPIPNRDPKGDPDVAHYIQRLESQDRVADLQVDLVVQKLALAPDAVVGDLGCGPGVFSAAFAKACPRGVVYACDIEPGQLDQVREKIHAQGLRNIVPILASVDDPHFPPGRLDLVFVGDTFHHLQDRVAYMQRLKTVLKPGGRVALLEYKPGKLPVGPSSEHKLAPGVLERELAEAGYVRIENFDTHPYHDFQVWRVK